MPGFIVQAVLYALWAMFYLWVFRQVNHFQGESMYNTGKCVMIIQGVEAAINFMNRVALSEIIGGVVLEVWYGYALYSLGQLIMQGIITRESPLGNPHGHTGGGVVIVQQPGYTSQQMMMSQPVQAIAMPVQGHPMQVQAVAMPVQATPVMATAVMTKPVGGARQGP